MKNPESSSDETCLEFESIGVALVVVVQGVKPLWKITCTNLDVYYTERRTIAELAEKAKQDGQLLKIGSLLDGAGRRILRSITVSVERRAGEGETERFESPRFDYLF